MHDDVFERFNDEGLVTDIIRPISSGKEAEVVLCRANPKTTGEELAAPKVYHDRERRDFRDRSPYLQGRYDGMLPSTRRGIERKGRFGRDAEQALWVAAEWGCLRELHATGVAVPRPIAIGGGAILMQHVGGERVAAPTLRACRPDVDEAEDLFGQVIAAVERMLAANVIHADLSPYNVLAWDGRATVIDLPQAIDPRKNREALHLLRRDLANVCSWFAKRGVSVDPDVLAHDLWTGWQFADLVPGDYGSRAPRNSSA